MNKKCDICGRPATHHAVEVIQGQKIEKNLCDQHALAEGLVIKAVHTPINELLTSFVKKHSGVVAQKELVCGNCGLTFSEFRENSLMGCPECYQAFDEQLSPLLERAHEGGTHHIGKVPRRAGAGEQRQQKLLRMRKQLSEAVAGEAYESAAKLRDEIRAFEEQR